jgi:hypothetical protein
LHCAQENIQHYKKKRDRTKKKKQETRNDQSLLKGNKTFKETTITAIYTVMQCFSLIEDNEKQIEEAKFRTL